MDFYLKHKSLILRSLGTTMLVLGLVIHFWATPKKALSENEKAAARIERMQASVKAQGSSSSQSKKSDTSKFLEKLKKTQAQQLQYMTILAMLFGVGFLGYSFLPSFKRRE